MVVLLIVIALLVLAGLGVFGFAVLWNSESAQKKAETNAEQILDDTFNGEPAVTVAVNMRTLKLATFITGAKQRGYQVLNDGTTNGYGQVVFEKVTSA